MERLGVKETFTDAFNVTDRHREASATSLRKNRQAKLDSKRKINTSGPNEGNNIPDMIRELNLADFLSNSEQCLIQLQKLDVILRYESEPYFAPSTMYPENQQGPYLFSNPAIIPRLVNMLTLVPCTELASRCLANIAAHDETVTWTLQLVKNSFPQQAIKMLEHSTLTQKTRENLLSALANIMYDAQQFRHLITCELPGFWGMLERQYTLCVGEFERCFRTAIRWDQNGRYRLPEVRIIMPCWTQLAQGICQTNEPDAGHLSCALAMVTGTCADYCNKR